MRVLLTGSAGFIGFHTARKLLARGDEVIGLDNINDYYDVNVKFGRLAETGIAKEQIEFGKLVQSQKYPNYRFIRLDLSEKEAIDHLFKTEKIDRVCHLAAQAGVRYSLTNPHAYMTSNIVGTLNILEACRNFGTEHLVYASSSSVYGLNTQMPFSIHQNVDHPVSLYATSKKANELMAHTYSHLFKVPTTGLRFFTVYGPWGRPDMALFLFTKAILEGKTIDVFNEGKMKRDFTYVDDIVEGVVRVIDHPAKPNANWSSLSPDPATSSAPYRIYNIGNSNQVELMNYIEALEEALGKTARKNLLPLQMGDVPATWSDTSDLERDIGYKPDTHYKLGIQKFVQWYKEFFKV